MPAIPTSKVTFTFSEAATNIKGWKPERLTTIKVFTGGLWTTPAKLWSPDAKGKTHHFNEAEIDGKVYRDLVVESALMPVMSGPKSRPANKFSKETISLTGVNFTFAPINLSVGRNTVHFGSATLEIKQGTWNPYTEKVYVEEAKVKGEKIHEYGTIPTIVKRSEIGFTIGPSAIPHISG
jgi:hypothetical protein